MFLDLRTIEVFSRSHNAQRSHLALCSESDQRSLRAEHRHGEVTGMHIWVKPFFSLKNCIRLCVFSFSTALESETIEYFELTKKKLNSLQENRSAYMT